MIEDMEVELTEASKINSKTDNSAVTEEGNVNETYKETNKVDIENINTFETRKKLYTTQWRTIYEVIEINYFK